MRVSQRLFRLLLRTYPQHVRDKQGADMWLTFESHLHDARLQGIGAVLSLWKRELVAAWQGGRRARVSQRHQNRMHRRRNPTGARHTAALGAYLLDFRLGLRMFVKYPGLTVVAGLGMAVAIAIGAGSFGVIYSMMDPTLPLDEGHRIVALQQWDTRIGNPNRQALHEFAQWREEVASVQDLGAYRPIARNLILPDGKVEPIRIAEMTGSGFRVARVQPLFGRPLIEADEREDAHNVVVIGYDAWQNQFAADPGVVGRTLQLGNAMHTVVGVMPPDFAFPVNYRFWTPLRLNPLDWGRGQGPSITMFGRLAPGFTLDEARAELTAIGQRTAAQFPETHEHLRPQVLPYTYPFFDVDTPESALAWHLLQLIISLLLVLVCINVAILVYARTAMRMREIAVRSALGASRRRIIAQLFIEALTLSGASAIAGIALAAFALKQIDTLIERVAGDQFPFWLTFDLSAGTIVYVSVLAVLAAAIVGVIPAVKATGVRVQSNLQRLASTGAGMQLGTTWTTLIVGQVAVAVAVLPAAVYYAKESVSISIADPGFAAQEFLGARLSMDADTPTREEQQTYELRFASSFRDRHVELVRRLENEPAVSNVTFALSDPGEERTVWVEIAGLPTPDDAAGFAVRWGSAGHQVRFNRVSVNYFDTFDLPILAGRAFNVGDADTTATAVIVNRTFVDSLLGDNNVLGRRVRYVGISGDADPENVVLQRWYEIVGVVPDFPGAESSGSARPKMYNAVATGELYPVGLAMQIRGSDAGDFAPRLREIAAGVDPALRLTDVLPLSEWFEQVKQFTRLSALGLCIVTASVLLLSAAGIYALMAFTVTQRRREIGIRTALGADRHNILIGVFRRAVTQLSIGVLVGALLAVLIDRALGGDLMGGEGAFLLPIVSTLMTMVGLTAALGPARRGLRIHPTEALREDG